jgi:murein DD-endopeptidase MepM/ murein hydrolase activator NlpD
MRTPIDGARLSSGFGMRRHPVLGYNKMHKGIDFAAGTGTPIYAAGDGTIEKRGWVGGYGNYIKIRHRSGLQTAYGHMSRFKAGLNTGSRVKQGEVIGYVGATGRVTGAHLHFGVTLNGTMVDPSLFLPVEAAGTKK